MSSVEWYVLHSQPRKEMLLSELVCSYGIHCFCPTIKVYPKNPRARKIIPYFPGYVFVQVDLEALGISTLNWMPYGTGLVSFDGIPASVPETIIESISRHVTQINSSESLLKLKYKKGDEILITTGIFEGYEAIFDVEMSGRERSRVFILLLRQSRKIPLEIPTNQIEIKKGKKY